jgi:hypothetical protein
VPLAALTLQFRLRSLVQRSIRCSSVYTLLLLLRAGCFVDPVFSMIPSTDQQQCHLWMYDFIIRVLRLRIPPTTACSNNDARTTRSRRGSHMADAWRCEYV